MAEHNELGKTGETIAKIFLKNLGFRILDLNYRTRYGELDIVAQKDKKIHFVEVKSVKALRGEGGNLKIRPEENITRDKWRSLVTSCETYLRHRNVPHVTQWQLDLACVYIDTEKREGRVVFMENILKE